MQALGDLGNDIACDECGLLFEFESADELLCFADRERANLMNGDLLLALFKPNESRNFVETSPVALGTDLGVALIFSAGSPVFFPLLSVEL